MLGTGPESGIGVKRISVERSKLVCMCVPSHITIAVTLSFNSPLQNKIAKVTCMPISAGACGPIFYTHPLSRALSLARSLSTLTLHTHTCHTHTHTHMQALKLQQRLHDAPTEKQEMARASQQQQRPGGLGVWGGESQGEGLSGRNRPNSGDQVASHGAKELAAGGRIKDGAGGRSGGVRSDEDGGSGGSEGGTAGKVDDDQVVHISV